MNAMSLISDHVAASCYSCATKFTAFRRRHHCRVCGQIFCHACCSIFVDGASLGKQSEVWTRTVLEPFLYVEPIAGGTRLRICSYCHDYHQKKRNEQGSFGSRGASAGAIKSSSAGEQAQPSFHSVQLHRESISSTLVIIHDFQLSSASSCAGRGPAPPPCRPCSVTSEWRPLRSIRTSAPATAPTPPMTTSTMAAMMMTAESPLQEPRDGVGGH